ncbi:hypothetical protein EYF80_003607 [Liparis tanakae]|uniref:Uncharacterized protein n=1 Tax=Liparis tanakae TaxID=230148 RepID=A0A4Z2J7Y2_9TELE|nr:hypothetical protein EYF80_003607 [Liparis tanakae]
MASGPDDVAYGAGSCKSARSICVSVICSTRMSVDVWLNKVGGACLRGSIYPVASAYAMGISQASQRQAEQIISRDGEGAGKRGEREDGEGEGGREKEREKESERERGGVQGQSGGKASALRL